FYTHKCFTNCLLNQYIYEFLFIFFFQAEDGIRDRNVTGVQTCALPIYANFHKIWLGHMLESLDMIGNQKIRVAMFIMENINKENELIMTYRVIAEKTNTSLQTVSETMKALQESNLL